MADDRPTFARVRSISAMSCATATPLSSDKALSAAQNNGSSEMLVLCPAIERDRLMGLFFSVKGLNATLRARRLEPRPVEPRIFFLPRQPAQRFEL